MKKSFPASPYDQALKYLKSVDFKNGEHELQSRIQEGTLTTTCTQRWNNSPNMMKGLFNCRSNIYEVVPSTRTGVLPPVGNNGIPLFYKVISKETSSKSAIKWPAVNPGAGKGGHTKTKKPECGQIIVPHGKELKIGTQKKYS